MEGARQDQHRRHGTEPGPCPSVTKFCRPVTPDAGDFALTPALSKENLRNVKTERRLVSGINSLRTYN